jgi:hypothetical protein
MARLDMITSLTDFLNDLKRKINQIKQMKNDYFEGRFKILTSMLNTLVGWQIMEMYAP